MAQYKEPTIEQMNEAIALFMGLKPRLVQPPDPALRCIEVWHNNESQSMKYHTSWDWLMPVVKKIKGMHFDILQRTLIMEYMHAAAPMNSALISIDIEKLHAGVYDFLLWYNQQPQTNE